ncbi:MAG: malto-oligosyltrehalose synthase, partial [Dehalococcoidia bacterium]
RLQFNHAFSFDDARRRLPYLCALGVSDVYASPYLRASAGSMHGYDIVDHNALNPEIGDEQSYARYVEALHAQGLRQLLDVVPNHMGILAGNRWWQDVLENGPGSRFAGYFDVDWQPPRAEMEDRVLLPVLGGQFGQVLEDGELRLVFDDGALNLRYYDQTFPIATGTYGLVLQPALDLAAGELPGQDAGLVELQSILTAIGHLPPRSETNPERVSERQRETAVIHRRLQALVEAAPAVRQAIARTVEIFNGRRNDPNSLDLLAELLDQQAYRLSYWRVAAEEINYRRFFDVNGLAALRMERAEVFEATHALILRLLAEGMVDGLRIDHPDGMRDPEGYLQRLQSRFAGARAQARRAADTTAAPDEAAADVRNDTITATDDEKPLYIVVEKILGHGERLPPSWPVDGTTGYDFLNQVNGLFVESGNRKAFDTLYRSFTGNTIGFRDLVYDAKKLIMRALLASEVNVLGLQLSRVAAHNRRSRDFTLNALTVALSEVIACFPIYRTYIRPNDDAVTERDRLYIDFAIERARRLNPVTDPSIFQFIQDTLMLTETPTPDAEAAQRDFVLKFQQVCGPVMAKGVEDTTFYRYTRLVALNEVGSDPDQFGISAAAFHRQNAERHAQWPHSMLATTTHDTKRSEDARARIAVLSELPGEWGPAVRRWARLNRKLKTTARGQLFPDRNDEYLLYQTLVGAWPFELLARQEPEPLAAFATRVTAYMEKAVREAKVHTSWITQNAVYEDALRAFISGVLAPGAANAFLRDALPLIRKVSAYGVWNSLSQTLLKLTCPGVPDLYQGTDLWDLSLVDPDNRRPVDYALRERLLHELLRGITAADGDTAALAGELLAAPEDGRIKLYVTHAALTFRQRHRDLFGAEDSYAALELTGSHAEHAVAFLRRLGPGREAALVVAPRLVTHLTKNGEPPVGQHWGDTAVILRGEPPGTRFRDLFTGAISTIEERAGSAALPLAQLLRTLPFSLAERIRDETEPAKNGATHGRAPKREVAR